MLKLDEINLYQQTVGIYEVKNIIKRYLQKYEIEKTSNDKSELKKMKYAEIMTKILQRICKKFVHWVVCWVSSMAQCLCTLECGWFSNFLLPMISPWDCALWPILIFLHFNGLFIWFLRFFNFFGLWAKLFLGPIWYFGANTLFRSFYFQFFKYLIQKSKLFYFVIFSY